MIKEIINKWDENKHILEEYLKASEELDDLSYTDLVRLILSLVLVDVKDEKGWEYNFAYENLVTIDHGHYQGTQLFVFPKDTYQPDTGDYFYTDTYYGSCSACDTLKAIKTDGEEEKIKGLMRLALHLVQKIKQCKEEEE